MASPRVASAPKAAASSKATPAPKKARTPREGTGASAGSGRVRASPTAPTYGERPPAPWHPLPISELLIFVGAIGAALGLSKVGHGLSSGGPALLAGIGAVAIGTVEVTLREHRSGYRSHTTMLALLVVLVFDSLVVLGLSAITTLPRLFEVGLLAVDVALFALLFKLLRARFLDARHARVLREG
ncbi:MAG: hypothetical protein ACHQE6_04485 [Solirubrobacterales bacterium]